MPPGTFLPIDPVLDATVTALIKDASEYQDTNVRAWRKSVSASPALIILTPQYNWSIPGQLKNLLDQPYFEWHGKDTLLVTYGGHGGGKRADQLKIVLLSEAIRIRAGPRHLSSQ